MVSTFKGGAVPRYFFDLEGHDQFKDDEGTDLADDNAARVEAAVFAGSYLKDHPELLWNGHEIRVVVRDEAGSIVLTLVTLAVDGR